MIWLFLGAVIVSLVCLLTAKRIFFCGYKDGFCDGSKLITKMILDSVKLTPEQMSKFRDSMNIEIEKLQKERDAI